MKGLSRNLILQSHLSVAVCNKMVKLERGGLSTAICNLNMNRMTATPEYELSLAHKDTERELEWPLDPKPRRE